ncbi:expressed unknown protein [Seminavis robusta]|uniref:Uncharacterized protein n=1 Tax=Seminavis robusta TaxID=568900 RepID=A0A9N8DEU7_9STRA|nr:expressed unknown protein [Seminavis robusta]|eukprot:Sro90_g047260.1 n/a (503) ;mRNA; r:23533-25041
MIYHDSPPQQRRQSLTYTKQRRSLIGENYAQRRRPGDMFFLYRAAIFGSFLMAIGLYISHESSTSVKMAQNVGAFLRRQRRPKQHASTTQLYYRRPRKQYARNVWTMTDFIVNGVNLASYGFETMEHPSQLLKEHFLLYEDFDISPELEEHTIAELEGTLVTPATTDLLLYHRHLEHPTLAFYMDRVALRLYYKAVGIPIPTSFVLKYKDDWKDKYEKNDDKQAILTFLPTAADYVVKASHRVSNPSTHLVSYDDQTQLHLMGSHQDKIDMDYDADLLAHQLTQAMHQEIQYTDPWSLLHVHPGIVVEDRISSFDSPHRPPLEIQVYVIWGKVWMGAWPHAEGPTHPGMIHRNGSVVMDDHAMVKVPDWVQWETIVEVAENLGAHKDIYQVNFLIGVPAETAHLLQHSSRQEQLAAIQVVVADTQLNPSIAFHEKELLDEMGRLWLAGYKMGIFKAVPNMEVPTEYVQKQQLTDADTREPSIMATWAKASFDWKLNSIEEED